MEIVEFNGWNNCVRLANDEAELIVTTDVGPRIIRYGLAGCRNVFVEIEGEQGRAGEDEWMIRGGHRFWIAPEEKPRTYELDNSPVDIEEIPGGVRTVQAKGPITGVSKQMEIVLAATGTDVSVVHTLRNEGDGPVELAPWALSAMAAGGMAVIPLPRKVSHTECLTHSQEWSLWGYTDFGDPRWTLGSRYILFRQDALRGPNKLGLAHREGWVAYQLGDLLFVKRFERLAGAVYPDGGVNFETFSNEDFLELESLGPLVALTSGASCSHEERWSLGEAVAPCATEEDVEANIIHRVSGGTLSR